MGVPVLKKPIFVGKIGAVSTDRISMVGAQWIALQYAETAPGRPKFYLEITTGELRGLVLPIKGNTIDELELDTALNLAGFSPGDLARGANGDLAQIRPCREIGEVFGADVSDAIIDPVSAIPSAGSAGDRIMIPDNNTAGFLKQPMEELFFVNEAGSGAAVWRSRSGGSLNEGAYPLLPGQAITIRKMSPTDTDLFVIGHVEEPKVFGVLPGGPGTEFLLTLRGSEPLSLVESGFESGALRASVSELERGDELLWFDPTAPAGSRSAQRHFIYVTNTGWVELGNPTGAQSFRLQPGEAFVLRKRDASADTLWTR